MIGESWTDNGAIVVMDRESGSGSESVNVNGNENDMMLPFPGVFGLAGGEEAYVDMASIDWTGLWKCKGGNSKIGLLGERAVVVVVAVCEMSVGMDWCTQSREVVV